MFTALYFDGSALKDITRSTKRKDGSGHDIVMDATKFLYLGSILKFNNAYLSMAIKSPLGNQLKVELYDGHQWNDVAHLVDETDEFTKDGTISFIPDLKKSWSVANTEDIPELDSLTIYSRHWLRISSASEIDFTLDYVGHKFSDDVDLFEEFAQLNSPTFLSYLGGTDFSQQAIRAAEIMERDLISMGKGVGLEQVLNVESLLLPSISKVAEIIYSQFGDEYRDLVGEIRKEYNTRLRKATPIIDSKNTGESTSNFKSSMTASVLKR